VIRGPLVVAVVAAMAFVACTEVGTDPNAVVAVRFDGSAYPSIVAGDSLRDSLGTLQPVRATGLNYKGEPVAGAAFVFSSPDTVLRVFANGNIFATRRKPDGTPARVFATIGSLQSQPDTLSIVPRADSIKAVKDVDTVRIVNGTGSNFANPNQFTVFGDTVAGAPKMTIQGWLVSFQLLYRGALLSPTDTSKAYTFIPIKRDTTSFRKPSFVDSTDAAGKVERSVAVRDISTSVPEDTIFLIATARARKAGSSPLRDTTMIIIRP
jgi:hypothetical protein